MTNDGLVGESVEKFQDNGNDFLCSQMVPNFWQAVIGNNNCPPGTIAQSTFTSKEEFCAFYNESSEQTKDCLNNAAAARIVVNLPELVKYETNFGRCCNE